MSILTYPLGFIGGGKEFYNGVIENSLRYNGADSPYLKRTFATAGNRKTWTLSWWQKKSELDSGGSFSAWTDNADTADIHTGSGGDAGIAYYDYNSGYRIHLASTAQFRDFGGWYHYCIAQDTTLALSLIHI